MSVIPYPYFYRLALRLAFPDGRITGFNARFGRIGLDEVRAKTLVELGGREDKWLEEETSFGSGQRVNNYFKWFP